MFNRLNYNPAYAGGKEVVDAVAIYRNQWWSGVDGSPKTLNVNVHGPLLGTRQGIGFSMIYDKIGLHKTTTAGLSYAYRIKLGKDGVNTLALGVGGRVENANADWTRAETIDLVDNLIDGTETTKTTANFGAGVYFTNPNYFFGVSVPRLMRNSLYTNSDDFTSSVNTYYFIGGVIVELNQNIKLYPNFLVSLNPNVPFDFDVNANLLFFDKFWLGASYRHEDSVDGLIQYQFSNGLRAGIAMDFTISDLSKVTTGSYEIMIGYTAPGKEILNFRYF